MNYQLKSPISEEPLIQILMNRGIEKENIYHFLNTSIEDTFDPKLLDRIKDGAKILAKHLKAQNKIFIQVDSDCDGFTSSALLINYLNCLFPYSAQNNIVYRIHDNKYHGLLIDTIPEETKLIIMPDSSSNDFEEHKFCADNGIDVLVLDHHEAEKISEYACIINNQLCDYPTKSLSGVGVTYKFCKYIDEIMGVDYADKYLDLVALGLIADMMDTRDYETHYYILKGLENVKNPYFKEMCERSAKHFSGGDCFMIDVAWYVAPYINAMTREGTLEEKLLVFESMLDFKAYEQIPSTKRGCKGQLETRVEQAGRTSINVKSRQNSNTDAGIVFIEKKIADENLLDNKILVIKLDSGDISNGLNGLVANKLANKYQRPVLVLQKVEKEDYPPWEDNYFWGGSARGYDKSDLKDFRQFLLDSELVDMAQGHANAFGVSISNDNLEKLIDYGNAHLDMIDGSVKYDVDFIWDANHLPEADILAIADYRELWGQYMEEPLIAIENIKLTNETVHFLGKTGNTLKINMPNGVDMMSFFIKQEDKDALDPKDGIITINAVGRCDKNVWLGVSSPQIKLEDYEIVSQADWYF